MTTAKAAPAPALVKKRRKAAEDLLAIHRKLAADFLKIDKLEAELKQLAGECGDSFREDFGADGNVSVSPPKPKTYKGEVPEVVPEAWNALKKGDQKRLMADGLIKVEPQWSNAFSGRVTVKVL
jgi:hypothetical protein